MVAGNRVESGSGGAAGWWAHWAHSPNTAGSNPAAADLLLGFEDPEFDHGGHEGQKQL